MARSVNGSRENCSFPFAIAFAYIIGIVVRRFALETTLALLLEAVALDSMSDTADALGQRHKRA